MQIEEGERERISSRHADHECESGVSWTRRDFWLVAGIATVGALARLCWVWAAISHFGVKKVYGGFEAAFVGASLAAGQGFSSVFSEPSGPTAWFAPVYPLIVSLAFRCFQAFTAPAAWALFAFNIACEVATIAAVYWIARRLFTPMIAFAAALFWAIDPVTVLYSVRIWESCVSALMAVLGIVFYLLLLDRPPRISWWIAYGLFWGVVALTNTTLVLMMPFALAALLVRWGRPARKCALAAILVFGCALVPWTVRNYVVFHKVIPVRGNFGAILWCGNRPDVKGPCDESMNAIQNLTERQAYLRLGDAEYVASRQRMALEFIAQNPGRFLELTRNRIVNFWAAAGREEAKLGLVASWSALAFAGLIGMLRKRPLISVPFAAALLLYPLPYYVTLACTFYRYPINPVVDLLAIYACATAGSWLLLRLQTRQV